MKNKNNVNVTIRMNINVIEKLKDIARKINYQEKTNVTYNELIVKSVYKEYNSEK